MAITTAKKGFVAKKMYTMLLPPKFRRIYLKLHVFFNQERHRNIQALSFSAMQKALPSLHVVQKGDIIWDDELFGIFY